MFVRRTSIANFHFREDFVFVAAGDHLPLGLATAPTRLGRMD